MLNTNAKINKHLMWTLCNFRPMLQHGMVFKKMKNDAIKKVVKSDCLDKFCIRYVLILLFVFYKSLQCKLISNFLSRLLPDLREYYRIFMFHMKSLKIALFLQILEHSASIPICIRASAYFNEQKISFDITQLSQHKSKIFSELLLLQISYPLEHFICLFGRLDGKWFDDLANWNHWD